MKKATLIGMTCAASLLLFLGGCAKEEVKGNIDEGQLETSTEVLSDGSEVDVAESTLKDDGYFKEIITGDKDPKVKFESEYKTDWSDDSWEDVDFKIDKVKVVEVDKYVDDEEKDYKGLMSMHFTLENKGTEEVKVHPNDATVVLNDGTEIKGEHFSDYWEDIFAADKKKDGHVHFKFTKIDQIDNIKEIKLSFDGHKKDSDEDKVDHTYDVSLPLELAK